MTTRRPISQFWLIGFILLGFALRLYRLGDESLWYDETVSAFLAGLSPAQLIAHTARDIHPPGYYLLLRYWAQAAGHTEFALAFFSVIFGVLLIPLTYLLGQHAANRAVAAWAALLVSVSPYHIWYSQEVRMYTLGAALGVIAAYCLLRQFATPAPHRYWLPGYILSAAIGLYALYYFAFLLLALNLFFVIYGLRRLAALKKLLLANGLLIAAYLPWLPIAWRQATNPPVPPWRSPPQLWAAIIESWSALSLGQSVEPGAVWPVLLVTLILLMLSLRAFPTNPSLPRFSGGWFLATYTFGPLLIIYLLSLITPLYHVRYLFTYAPAFYVLIAVGIVYLSMRIHFWAALAAMVVIVTSSFYSLYQFHFDPQYRPDNFRAAVRFIDQRWQPGDAILINAGYAYTAFDYYSRLPRLERRRLVPYRPPHSDHPLLLQAGAVDGQPQLGWGDPRADFYAMSAAETVQALEQISADFPRLWLLRAYDTVTDPDGLIRAWLARRAIPLEDQPFSGSSNIRAQGYLLTVPPPPATSQPVAFENGMALLGWQLPNQPWQPGQTIHLKLWWAATAPPGVDYKTSLKLWAPNGQLAAQGQDEWPVGALYRATAWPLNQPVYHPVQITIPPQLSPGQYWLNAELYHPETIQPLARKDTGENSVTLGPVNIKK